MKRKQTRIKSLNLMQILIEFGVFFGPCRDLLSLKRITSVCQFTVLHRALSKNPQAGSKHTPCFACRFIFGQLLKLIILKCVSETTALPVKCLQDTQVTTYLKQFLIVAKWLYATNNFSLSFSIVASNSNRGFSDHCWPH